MSVAKTIEIVSTSKIGFDDAVKQGVSRACKTVHAVKGAWVMDQEIAVEDAKITEYRVRMKVTFVLED